MKHTRTFLKPVFGLLLAASGLFAAGQASAQSFTDHTKVRPLTGKITIRDAYIPSCPTGEVLSGGSCTAVSSMISNQGGYDRAWTANFIGQRKCVGVSCATINSDGTIQFTAPSYFQNSNVRSEVPFREAVVTYAHSINICGFMEGATAAPIFTAQDRFNGSAPSSWTIVDFRNNPDTNCGGY